MQDLFFFFVPVPYCHMWDLLHTNENEKKNLNRDFCRCPSLGSTIKVHKISLVFNINICINYIFAASLK